MQKPCKTCGQLFTPIANQHYCGNPCVSPSAKLYHRGGMKEPVECPRCGESFIRAHTTQKYCSRTCRAKATPRSCRTCGTEFTPIANQQYCSKECKNPRSAPERRDCVRCGVKFETRQPSQKYCSSECRDAKPETPRWLLNERVEYKDSTWRKYVIELCGGVCVDCGQAKEPLHAHHLIPKARGGKNVIHNGIALCSDCHRVRHDNSLAGDDLVERIVQRLVEVLDQREAS